MKLEIAALCVVALGLAACSKPEPEVVYLEPTYEKFGGPTCPAGYLLATLESSGATVCAPATSVQ